MANKGARWNSPASRQGKPTALTLKALAHMPDCRQKLLPVPDTEDVLKLLQDQKIMSKRINSWRQQKIDNTATDLLHKTWKLSQRKRVSLQLFSPENILFSVTQHFSSSLLLRSHPKRFTWAPSSSPVLDRHSTCLPPCCSSSSQTGGGTGGSLAGKLTCHFGQRQESFGRNRFGEVAKSCKMCL